MLESKTISNAKYVSLGGQNIAVMATINNVVMSVPCDPDNTDFAEIQKQVAAGTLTIEDAD